MKSLFLDRDGVINYNTGYTYIIDDFIFIDGIFELCNTAQNLGYLIIVVTNQSGIGRKYFDVYDFNLVTNYMVSKFKSNGVNLTHVFYCPDTENSKFRKPNPGMITYAIDCYGIDVSNSILIGDSDSDMEAAFHSSIKHRWLLSRNIKSIYSTSSISTHYESITLINTI